MNYFSAPGLRHKIRHIDFKNRINLNLVINTVCDYFDISKTIVLSKTRKQDVVKLRQMICKLAFKHCQMNKLSIGRELNYDHSSVIHSIQASNNDYSTDEGYRRNYDAVEYVLITL